ncbi:MAG: hypothetical protein GY805_15490 [Chloroflexi bacterium]|nr:hypothetical protein [Chloroflexota bacterium]
MLERLSKFIDKVSEFLAHRKGLVPLLGMLLVAINAILQFFPVGWLAETDIVLHVGVIVAIFGILLGWAL